MVAVRFKRVAEAFGDVGRVRRLCESSSGSDHSPPPTQEEEEEERLSDLVNSFIERDSLEIVEEEEDDVEIETILLERRRRRSTNNCTDQTTKNGSFKGEGLFVNSLEGEEDEAKHRIIAAVEKALDEVGGNLLSPDFNRRLMARLRYRGFDSGLCKSKWEKTGSCPSSGGGYHEYIDVMLAGNRYIVEVSLAKEFEIARPTASYQQLLNQFPQIFVGKEAELKHIVKVMCKCMKKSMKTMEMTIPPWRRHTYVHAKWFSSYKRTTNEFSTSKLPPHDIHIDIDIDDIDDELIRRRRYKSVGFVPPPALVLSPLMLYVRPCRGNFKMGNLAAALQETHTTAAALL